MLTDKKINLKTMNRLEDKMRFLRRALWCGPLEDVKPWASSPVRPP